MWDSRINKIIKEQEGEVLLFLCPLFCKEQFCSMCSSNGRLTAVALE